MSPTYMQNNIETKSSREELLKVENLKRYFPAEKRLFLPPRSFIHAVDGISFSLKKGETLGLVGESGCGKTTTGRLLIQLDEPTEGRIRFFFGDNNGQGKDINNDGEGQNGEIDLAALQKRKEIKLFRQKAQMIFQDPYESLNPRMTVFDTISEPLKVHSIGNALQRRQKAEELLSRVGMTPASNFLFRFPHELSGGQRQRVALARALVIEPDFIVADEPTSMLDISIRTEIMKLMLKLQQDFEVSYLFITHDLAVARYMCHEIAVMYLGKIVEQASTEELISEPYHPYTSALLTAVPVPDPSYSRGEVPIKKGVSEAINPPDYCRFYERCPESTDECKESPHPELKEVSPGHWASCHNI